MRYSRMMLLIYLCCLAWISLTKGNMLSLSYNRSGLQQLRLQCPNVDSVDGDLLMIELIQIPDYGAQTTLALWQYGEKVVRSNRVKVEQTGQESEQLVAVLHGVACYDSGFFMCKVIAENNVRGTFYCNESQRFTFPGEITKPTIIREPAGKTCYEISDKLSLNCTASIGTTGNEIIWEEAHHEGRFSTITNETDRAKLLPADQRQRDTECTVHSHLALDYFLREEDDGKTFRCRLFGGPNDISDQITVSVKRDKKECMHASETASNGHSTTTNTKDGQLMNILVAPTTTSQDSRGPVFRSEVRKARVEKSRKEPGKDAGSEAEPFPTLLIILTVIPVAVAMLLVSMAILLRQWRKKQQMPPPVVVVGSPSPSEYGCLERRLPDLPHLEHLDHTTPKWVSTHHGDNDVNANTSIYVSMSGLDVLHREGVESAKPNLDSGLGSKTEISPEEAEPNDDEPGPDMRTDRSESMYSNKEAIEREGAAARANAKTKSSTLSACVKEDA